MVPTVKDPYTSFAVLYIAPSGQTTNSPASPRIEQACSLFDPLVIFFPVCPIELDTKRTLCIDAPGKALTV